MSRFFIIWLFLALACKTTSQSGLKAPTAVTAGETLDLTRYEASEADYLQFKNEMGDTYQKLADNLQQNLQDNKRILPESYKKLRQEEQIAIYHYTGEGFRRLNPALRKEDLAAKSEQAGFIKVLSSALNKLPVTQGLVYRGGMLPAFGDGEYFSPFHEKKTVDPARFAQFKVGQVYVEQGFMSTSQHDADGIRQSFGCREALYTVRSKYGRDISAFAVIAGEREILFVPGSEFKILSIVLTYPPENNCRNEVVELEVEQVDPGSLQKSKK